ncbi:hypothetical protein LF1_21880 [Rubripirellula obstinata]|uniref:Polysaccharide biosynthesis protein n=1 Tax=Rubripirellula obstinata TaxID=406547 RepID=A0A5B1CJM4_9BACT|nr:hypothetical protein [Rubripirellula obstinata]KAA1259653.1 hypothetical protein LF1_21880 [Rubripirellula obstinata]
MFLDPLRPIFLKTGLDRAVLYGILMKCWQIPSGVVTMLMIAFFFDPETQGVYYTIFGILGLQNMAEAGLTSVLMHAVSHESARVQISGDGNLTGTPDAIGRIASLTRGGVKCLLGCGVLFAIIALVWGLLIFRGSDESNIGFVLLCSVLLSAASLVSAGLVAILEGCNQVVAVNRNRLGQVVCGSFVVWVVIATGGTLWAIPASLATQLIWEMKLIAFGNRKLMLKILKASDTDLNWRQEIWPLQWKLGLQGFVHQFAFTPMIPVLYHWHGPVVAGQAGMTLSTLLQLLGVASMWIRTRAPQFGELIAQEKRSTLDQVFRKVTISSTAALVALMTLFCSTLFLMGNADHELLVKLASRFLPVQLALGIAIATLPIHLMQCFAIYLRSHKVDPLWRITIASNLLLTLAVVLGEIQFGAIALGASITLVYGFITLPTVFMVWHRFRTNQSPAKSS